MSGERRPSSFGEKGSDEGLGVRARRSQFGFASFSFVVLRGSESFDISWRCLQCPAGLRLMRMGQDKGPCKGWPSHGQSKGC